jgi:hypothetical protein
MDPTNEEVIFTRIFNERAWGGRESASGIGSDMASVGRVLRELPIILRRLGVKSIVDAPCGDMNWMRRLEHQFKSFIGIDIVPAIVCLLRQQIWPEYYHFQVGNITTDILPRADLVFCRDCLVHLPFEKIREAVRLFKKGGFLYIIATTFPARRDNQDCLVGQWRPLNMSVEPFCWMEPLLLLSEREAGDGFEFPDKSLGVWALDSLPVGRECPVLVGPSGGPVQD